jgi:signal transduction histidine kinase
MEPKKASETILLETARLNEMVKDLLYISKIDNITSAFTATSVNLIEIIRECARRHQAVAEKKQVKFPFAFEQDTVYFDCVDELISRAIENLISNAIRYAKSEIIISCTKIMDKIEICVKDDGAGIGEKTLPHIFERFYKGEDGDYGIGLSIVKSIIEQHGGGIKAENTNDGGAVFTAVLQNENRRQ